MLPADPRIRKALLQSSNLRHQVPGVPTQEGMCRLGTGYLRQAKPGPPLKSMMRAVPVKRLRDRPAPTLVPIPEGRRPSIQGPVIGDPPPTAAEEREMDRRLTQFLQKCRRTVEEEGQNPDPSLQEGVPPVVEEMPSQDVSVLAVSRPDLSLVPFSATVPEGFDLTLSRTRPDISKHLPRLVYAESLRPWIVRRREYQSLLRRMNAEVAEEEGPHGGQWRVLRQGPYGPQQPLGENSARRAGEPRVSFLIRLP